MKEKFVTIDLNFLTLESACEASETNLVNVIFMRKSCASEDFLDFGQLKVPFKVTFMSVCESGVYKEPYTLVI